jgi:Xaa-Pro aminopeptidase
MTETAFARLETMLAAKEIDGALLTSSASLAYFSGYETQIEWGAPPWLPCPAALLWMHGERPVLFLAEGEDSEPDQVFDQVRFVSYVYQEPLPGIQSLIASLRAHFDSSTRATIGAELAYLPFAIQAALTEWCPQLRFADISSGLAELRAIKTSSELQRIREAVRLCDCGQRAAKLYARDGMKEIELYSLIHAEIEVQAGCRVPLVADLLSGPRTALASGAPTSRTICTHDLVLVDLLVRYSSYWGDSCNTIVIGPPNKSQQSLFERVLAALQESSGRVQPGLSVGELDHLLRQKMTHAGSSFPHHSGHGIGVTWHEEPRIVPYSSTVLREGMVIALEPGIYVKDRCGVRLESVVAVTSTGAELLTGFTHTL